MVYRKQPALKDNEPYQLIQAYEGNRAELHSHIESSAFHTADLIAEDNARLCCSCRHLPVSLILVQRGDGKDGRGADVDVREGSVKSC